MGATRDGALTSVKRSIIRHPAVVGAGAGALVALLVLNALAFVRGLESPWLLGGVIIADMLAIGVGIIVAAREVLVAEHRTEASEAQLAVIVDSAMDAIITVDAAQNIVLFNRAAEQIFRCPRREALGAPLDRFLPPRFRAAHRGHIEHFARTGVTSRRMGDVTTLWGLRADGEEFPLEASISQAASAGERYYTVILRDITLRKQAEAEAARIRGELGEAQARLARHRRLGDGRGDHRGRGAEDRAVQPRRRAGVRRAPRGACSARRSTACCRRAFAARTAATSRASAAPASPAGAWATSPRCGRCARTAARNSRSRPRSRRRRKAASATTP